MSGQWITTKQIVSQHPIDRVRECRLISPRHSLTVIHLKITGPRGERPGFLLGLMTSRRCVFAGRLRGGRRHVQRGTRDFTTSRGDGEDPIIGVRRLLPVSKLY